MPIHDWSKVRAGVFHDFHQGWTIEIRNALNRGLLPTGFFAMAEQVSQGRIPDVICLERIPVRTPVIPDRTGIAVMDHPPTVHLQQRSVRGRYAAKANRITIREPLGEVVAVIEVVSPGNKSSKDAVDSFIEKAVGLIQRGIHVLIVDLFPSNKFVPQGIHAAIWEQLDDDEEIVLPEKPLTVVSYESGEDVTAYINSMVVGDSIPDPPIFLKPGYYVTVPLETTYQTTWSVLPEPVRELFVDV